MSGYSKMLGWEVYNFMSIGHGTCSFDERGIINFKGYNDSGKSAMLTALRVLFTNFQSSKQNSFIRDDCDYFRIIAYFDDGVKIMRDKYINGQSLYEMYKDDTLLYSTKSSTGVLTRVKEVPEPIAQYLALIDSDDTYLNFRSCFEKQIGVQTSGSENYKMFNNVLKSEEIASASALLNNDKNKLVSEIADVEAELNGAKKLLGNTGGITESMIVFLKDTDAQVDTYEATANTLTAIQAKKVDLDAIHITPMLSEVSDISSLQAIMGYASELSSIHIAPHLESIDGVDTLAQLVSIKSQIHDVQPELREVAEVNILSQLSAIIAELNTIDISSLDAEIESAKEELEQLSHTSGIKMKKCPNCGEVIIVE